jgi:hypothetical protein
MSIPHFMSLLETTISTFSRESCDTLDTQRSKMSALRLIPLHRGPAKLHRLGNIRQPFGVSREAPRRFAASDFYKDPSSLTLCRGSGRNSMTICSMLGDWNKCFLRGFSLRTGSACGFPCLFTPQPAPADIEQKPRSKMPRGFCRRAQTRA